MITVLVVRAAGEHVIESLKVKSTEWLCTIAAFLFGYALAQPESTFALSGSYAVMQAAVDFVGTTEEVVGWSILVLALIRLAVLGYNGLWSSSPIARRWMALAYTLLWASLFVGFWSVSGFASAGTGFVLTLMMGEMVNTIRTSGEIGRIPTLHAGKRVDDRSGH